MSTQIQLYVQTEELTDDLLQSEGIIGGPLTQLSAPNRFDEFMDALSNSQEYIVGSDLDEEPKRIRDLFDGPTIVDETTIDQAKATTSDEDLIEWLNNHSGESVFAVSINYVGTR
ncbi:MAG: hypothetical protein ABEH81_00870 [Halopenitus sp.]